MLNRLYNKPSVVSDLSVLAHLIPHKELLLLLHILPELTSAENGPQIGPGVMDTMDFNTLVFFKQPEGPDCKIFTKWH